MFSQAQNIYDDPQFFSAYSTLPRSQHGFAAAPEWPTLQDMILHPSAGSDEMRLQGSRVLDLGSGYGWFVRWARENKVEFVKGVDISAKMIERAKSLDEKENQVQTRENFCYELHDIGSIILDSAAERESYDLVYSSLTFHYIEDLGRLFRQIHASLRKGNGPGRGRLVFSVEHPIFSAPVNPEPDWTSVKGDTVWPLNSYSEEGWRVTSWLGTEGVKKYHRTTETYVSLLLENGFVLTGLKDWAPSREDVEKNPEWSIERHRPFFLLIAAEAL
ncbi:C6 transcription factor [Penicillium macrosclerotiorum]|uniref:C6 transcription factor n=1 Tax=Penicillium macrosclerotiorum TaxID=303699 RepID=UPI002546CC56|nr:C6 transcription factor [Penicillium macrosclerotiorum]KAJ5692821.1 C6 transcription factor [Penicillium macrosclerotiorum]